MDSLITAAARALAAGDPLGALKRVALRDDAPALALRGIAMAQLGHLVRPKALLRSATRAYGPKEAVARARCVVAEAEIALVSRDLGRWRRSVLLRRREEREAQDRPPAQAAVNATPTCLGALFSDEPKTTLDSRAHFRGDTAGRSKKEIFMARGTFAHACCTTRAAIWYWAAAFAVLYVAGLALAAAFPMVGAYGDTLILAALGAACFINFARNRTLHCLITGPIFGLGAIVAAMVEGGLWPLDLAVVWGTVLVGVGVAFVIEWRTVGQNR